MNAYERIEKINADGKMWVYIERKGPVEQPDLERYVCEVMSGNQRVSIAIGHGKTPDEALDTALAAVPK